MIRQYSNSRKTSKGRHNRRPYSLLYLSVNNKIILLVQHPQRSVNSTCFTNQNEKSINSTINPPITHSISNSNQLLETTGIILYRFLVSFLIGIKNLTYYGLFKKRRFLASTN